MTIPAVSRRIPQVGAQFGFAKLWTMLFSYPLMAGIQEISASIGRVTGMGIAGNI
jgi:Mn2+/Fe2+ NRAMP family transporter